MAGRSFDGIVNKFAKNIYGTSKGKIREAVVLTDLEQVFSLLPQRTLSILDAGGGYGHISQQLVAKGHRLVLNDMSEDMLELAQFQCEEKGLSDRVEFLPGLIQELPQALESRSFDLVMCHAVLEWLPDPESVVRRFTDLLNPGGMLSLMFYNRHGQIMHNMVAGNFDFVAGGFQQRKQVKLTPGNPQEPTEVLAWVEDSGLEIKGRSGVRVFHDLLRNKQAQTQQFEELLELEQRYCRQEPYISMGRYYHVWAQKPGDQRA